uniref:Cation-transporting P-type ATPase N-terminal domain-containing protein n=2 Tax=Panagrolaimus TaxID=55784 RepID=A0A914Q8C7_9BILA
MSNSEYGISIEDLKKLMVARKQEGREAIDSEYGGTDGLCGKLKTDPQNGIPNNSDELERRRNAFGANEIPPHPPKSFFTLVWEALQVNYLYIFFIDAKKILCLK